MSENILNKKHEVLVVGSGMVGISSALELQKKGYNVTIIDNQGLGKGTSSKNACVLTSSFVVPFSNPTLLRQIPGYMFMKDSPLRIRYSYLPFALPFLTRFLWSGTPFKVQKSIKGLQNLFKNHNSYQAHKELAEGTEAAQYLEPMSMAYVYPTKKNYLADSYTWDIKRKSNIKVVEYEGKQLRERYPFLNPEIQFAATVPESGKVVNPKKYSEALFKGFFDKGGCYIQTKALSISSNQETVTVETDSFGSLTAINLVVASGVWSKKLVNSLGDRVSLDCEGGYYVEFHNPGMKYEDSIAYNKTIATCLNDRIRLAGIVEIGGVDCKPNYDICQSMLKTMKYLLPGIRAENVTRGHGQRPATSDSLPVISQSGKFKNVFYAFGHHHMGYSTGPLTGRLIAQMVAKEKTEIDVEPYSIKRF